MYVWILVLLLTVGSSDDSVEDLLLAPVQNGDLGFLRALNNYFGCKTWVDGKCTQCSPNYIFNDNQICRKISPQCMKFNRGVGICEQCYLGYSIYTGQCVLDNIAESIDRGCRKFQNRKCVECSERYYFGQSQICLQVSDSCRKWNYNNGQCTACYQGYQLEEGQCIQRQLLALGTIDAFCAQWSDDKCLKCSERAFFGPIGLCIPVSDYCRTWDNFDGFCLSCYKGYDLINGQCNVSLLNSEGPSDMGCKRWDWDNQICLECSQRWVFTGQGACKPVSDDCKLYHYNGSCSQCYTGYDLKEGTCEFSQKNLQGPSDLGCRYWNWEKMICLQCSERWTFNDQGLCTLVSDDCKQYNEEGKCTLCYRGYDLIESSCVISTSNSMQPTDPGCKIWDWQEQICLQCSHRWFFNQQGNCQKVADICDKYSPKGACTSCYQGYSLNNGTCSEDQNDRCQQKENGVCIECYLGYQLKNNKCILGNPLCRLTNSQGHCTSCFTTYVLYKNICVPLVKLVNLAEYYAANDPQKLEQLKREGRIV